MRSLCLLLLTSIASASSFAADPLMRAKTSLELELAVVEREEVSALEKTCEVELRGAGLPRACFKLMRLSKKEPAEWLERVCEKRARVAARVETLRETDGLSDHCRELAKERLDDLRYRIEEEEPEKLLDDVRRPDSWSGS